MTSPTNDRNLPHQDDPTDLRIRRLQERLRAAETLCDLAWNEGYKAAERTLHVPDELITALRHGSAHEHAHIPIDDQLVAIVLARPGTGHPCPAEETRVWEELQGIHREVTDAAPAADCMLRRELPPAIGAMTWRAHDHLIVVRGRGWHRRCLKRALHCHRGAWALIPIAACAAVKALRSGAGATSVALATATTVTVVTIAVVPSHAADAPRAYGSIAVTRRAPQDPFAYSPPASPSPTPSPKVARTVSPTPDAGTATERPDPGPIGGVSAPTPAASAPVVNTAVPTPVPVDDDQPVRKATSKPIARPSHVAHGHKGRVRSPLRQVRHRLRRLPADGGL